MQSPVQSSSPTQTLERKRFVPWIIYVIFFAVLNETVFNVSTPKIAGQFDLLPTQVSWIVTVFIITFGLGQIIYGKLADIFQLRRLIVIGISTYCAASLFGFLFQAWYPAVIVARAIQGAGASAIPALVMVAVARYFTPEDRGKLFGVLTSTVSFAIGIGPVLGGFIAAYFHWSYLFLISLFTALSIPAFLRLLPTEEKKKGKVDIPGAAYLAVGITSLILYCTDLKWVYLVISLAALSYFVFHIRRASAPFVDPKLFVSLMYRSALVIGFLIFGAVLGIMFVIPLMLHHLHGLETDTIGLIMFPGAFSAVIFGTVAGNLTVKKGSHFVVYSGFTLIVASLLVLSSVTDKWVWYTAGALILMYIGFSFIQTALAESVTQILPMDQIGVGMGFYGLISFIAGAIGTAIVARLLDNGLFNFALLPIVHRAEAHLYSNLLVVFTLLIAASGLMYYASLGRNKRNQMATGVHEKH